MKSKVDKNKNNKKEAPNYLLPILNNNNKVITLQNKVKNLEQENSSLMNNRLESFKNNLNLFNMEELLIKKEEEISLIKKEVSDLKEKLSEVIDIEEYNLIKKENKFLKERITELERKLERFNGIEQEIENTRNKYSIIEQEYKELLVNTQKEIFNEKVNSKISLKNTKEEIKSKIQNAQLYLNLYLNNRENETLKLLNNQNRRLIFESSCILKKNDDIEKSLDKIKKENKQISFSNDIYKELVEDLIKTNINNENKNKSHIRRNSTTIEYLKVENDQIKNLNSKLMDALSVINRFTLSVNSINDYIESLLKSYDSNEILDFNITLSEIKKILNTDMDAENYKFAKISKKNKIVFGFIVLSVILHNIELTKSFTIDYKDDILLKKLFNIKYSDSLNEEPWVNKFQKIKIYRNDKSPKNLKKRKDILSNYEDINYKHNKWNSMIDDSNIFNKTKLILKNQGLN